MKFKLCSLLLALNSSIRETSLKALSSKLWKCTSTSSKRTRMSSTLSYRTCLSTSTRDSRCSSRTLSSFNTFKTPTRPRSLVRRALRCLVSSKLLLRWTKIMMRRLKGTTNLRRGRLMRVDPRSNNMFSRSMSLDTEKCPKKWLSRRLVTTYSTSSRSICCTRTILKRLKDREWLQMRFLSTSSTKPFKARAMYNSKPEASRCRDRESSWKTILKGRATPLKISWTLARGP